MLALLCGGPTSTFPNTAIVKFDFSLLECEEDDAKKCPVDLCLDGVLHRNQWITFLCLNRPINNLI
jgi:hypothetical protein